MGHGPVKIDPAIERFNRMREEAYMNFKWTQRTSRTALWGFIIIPGALFYFANNYHLRWNWVGKRRGESLDATTPRTAPETE
ncbi:hypothetical protein BDQ12DRAFT_676922 [Crucibulum laeve]|uniref:Complex I-B15 n=1 Tax=Crucibulum laeve TaxID=68775 RepID=A0A5C3MCI3_9AGAR|nr:hypothetical protein BDQ12DRAFT_676922 [Crucibulum laeve]